MGSVTKFLFSELISFGSPRAIVFNLSSILSVLYVVPTNYLTYSPIRCIFKYLIFPFIFGTCPTTGIIAGCNCPGCGMTRGMSRLLHGDLKGAIAFNKLVPILFIVMISVLIYNIYIIVNKKKCSKNKIRSRGSRKS
jgi:hypothetical protein